MFDNLGIQWAGTLVGCLALVCVPIPVCFYLFGKKLRQKSKFAPTMTIKKPVEEESSEDEEEEHGEIMAALHATRSKAHHDLPTKMSRTRTSGVNGNPVDDVEKNLSKAAPGEKKQE
jgi:hypothetical protein